MAQFNRTKTQFPDNVALQELIEAQIDAHLSNTAVICDYDKALGVSSLTYAQLNDKVNQLAHRTEGRKESDREQIVAMMVERSFAMIIGVLGIVKAGGAYLPVPPDNPPDRIDYMLKDGGVRILLVQGKTAARSFSGTDHRSRRSGQLPRADNQPNRPQQAAGSGVCDLYFRIDRQTQGSDDRAPLARQPPALDATRLPDR